MAVRADLGRDAGARVEGGAGGDDPHHDHHQHDPDEAADRHRRRRLEGVEVAEERRGRDGEDGDEDARLAREAQRGEAVGGDDEVRGGAPHAVDDDGKVDQQPRVWQRRLAHRRKRRGRLDLLPAAEEEFQAEGAEAGGSDAEQRAGGKAAQVVRRRQREDARAHASRGEIDDARGDGRLAARGRGEREGVLAEAVVGRRPHRRHGC
mmetsp:Transcript_35851/g.112837  ORF Transcript_35851/g.112837 Transcript_35851/m.112837 type:complete len:207 (-) Transcript_35851:61-681(-)